MATQTTLLNQYQQLSEKARLSNLERQKAVESIFDEIISRYRPGGEFGKSYEAELATQKVQDVGKTAQRDISRGMYGIRPYEQEWEKTVGSGARLKLEDLRMERLSGAQTGKASFIENISNPYPDYGPLMNAYSSSASAPTSTKNDWMINYRPLSEFMNQMTSDMGGGGSTYTPRTETDFSSQNTLIAQREKEMADWRAKQTTNTPTSYNPNTSQIGQPSPLGAGKQQSVFDQPPQWTGNYQTWKTAMDAYNKAHGLSLSGY